MGECAECQKRREASRAQAVPPMIVSGGICPRCHGVRGVGIKPVGEKLYECLDPRCAFRWSECVGCGS
jgi:hypothetical protein